MNFSKAYLGSTLSAIIVGLSFMFVKNALVFGNPIDILAHRFTIALLALLLYMAVTQTKLSLKFADLITIMPVALFYPVLYFTFQTFGLLYMPSSQAGIIQAMVPIITLLISSLFLRERATTTQKVGIFFSVAGVIYLQFLNGADQAVSFLGILLIGLSVLSMSINQVLAKQSANQFAVFDISFVSIILGFIGFNALSLGKVILNQNTEAYISALSHPSYLLSLLYLGAFSSFGTTILNLFSLSKLSTIKVSIFGNFSTLISIAAGVVLLKEHFGFYHLLGATAIILGVLMVNVSQKNKGKSAVS